MLLGLGSLLAGGLWIVLAVVGAYGVAVGVWRVMDGRARQGFSLLLIGCIAFVLFFLLGVAMR